MNVHSSLLGLYHPGTGWLFRINVGWKYVLLLLCTVPALVVWQWWFTLASPAIVLLLLRTSGISFRRALDLGTMLWVMIAILCAYQLFTLRLSHAITSPGNLLLAVLAARMLTLTTSTPALLDALARALGPLRWLRVDPDRVALAVAIMVRSIPYLLGSISEVRDAARARGRDRSVVGLLIPAMVGAVAYAERTGEALHARGLADSPGSHEPEGPEEERG